MENLYLQQNSQEQLLQKLNQLEEEYTPLQQLIKQISETTNNNEEYSESIQQEGNHPDLLAHQENRSRISEEKYNKITSQIDPSSLLVYVKHSVNYQRGTMQSTVAGYTPALYELLMNSSYEFKQFIQTRGFVDPTSWKMATSDNDIIGQSQFLSSPQNIQEETNLNFQDVEIMSFDNQRFPASHNITVHNLVEDYDKEHNLQLKFSDVLIVHSFTLKYPDQLVVYNLKKTEKKDSSSTKNSEILRKSISKYKQTSDSSSNELLDKYYGDQLENLIKKGSKWYKRCGYIDIPKKKTRKINQ